LSLNQERSNSEKSSNIEEIDFSRKSITRWKKEDDKKLFKEIRKLEAQGLLSLEEILQMDPGRDIKYHSGVKLLSEAIEWKSVRKTLVKRIHNLCNGGFSVRDIKRLKKDLKTMSKSGEIDYEVLIYNYPGKPLNKFKQV